MYHQVNEVNWSFKGFHSKEQASLQDSQEVSLNSNTQLFFGPVTSRHEPPSGFTLSYQSPSKDRPGLPKPIADRYRGAGNVPIHQSKHCSHHRLTQRRAIKQNSQLAKLLMPTQASQAPPANGGPFNILTSRQACRRDLYPSTKTDDFLHDLLTLPVFHYHNSQFNLFNHELSKQQSTNGVELDL